LRDAERLPHSAICGIKYLNVFKIIISINYDLYILLLLLLLLLLLVVVVVVVVAAVVVVVVVVVMAVQPFC
jgi:hypothetical protein